MMRFINSLLFILFLSFSSYAQVDVGLGPELGFPMMFNKAVGDYHHALGSVGVRATVSYLPQQSTFIPVLVVNVSPVRLPVAKFNGSNAVFMSFTRFSASLNGRIRKVMDKKEFQFGLGVGVSYMQGNGYGLNGSDNFEVRSFIADSSELINMVVPSVTLNAEYIFPISSQVPLYMGIGGQVQYEYFFDKGRSYNVGIIDAQYQYYRLQTQLFGHMVNPSVYLSVYYRFGNRNMY